MKKKKEQKILIILLIIFSVIAGIFSFLYYKNEQKLKEEQKQIEKKQKNKQEQNTIQINKDQRTIYYKKENRKYDVDYNAQDGEIKYDCHYSCCCIPRKIINNYSIIQETDYYYVIYNIDTKEEIELKQKTFVEEILNDYAIFTDKETKKITFFDGKNGTLKEIDAINYKITENNNIIFYNNNDIEICKNELEYCEISGLYSLEKEKWIFKMEKQKIYPIDLYEVENSIKLNIPGIIIEKYDKTENKTLINAYDLTGKEYNLSKNKNFNNKYNYIAYYDYDRLNKTYLIYDQHGGLFSIAYNVNIIDSNVINIPKDENNENTIENTNCNQYLVFFASEKLNFIDIETGYIIHSKPLSTFVEYLGKKYYIQQVVDYDKENVPSTYYLKTYDDEIIATFSDENYSFKYAKTFETADTILIKNVYKFDSEKNIIITIDLNTKKLDYKTID